MEQRDLKQVGERIKELRRELRISQKDFAEKIEISGSFLSEVEACKSKPGYEFLNSIIAKFNVNPIYLMTGQGKMFYKRDKGGPTLPDDDYGEYTDVVKDMLHYFKESQLVKMAVLEFFKRYIYTNKDMIREDIEYKRETHLQNHPAP